MKFYNVFSEPLSGKQKEYYIKNLEDRVFNSLYSYWYLKKCKEQKIMESFAINKGNIMIDSGAFTAWSKDIKLDVDEYLTWINKWDKYITIFGQIDVIPPKKATKEKIDECCKQTWQNYLYMRSRMKSPEKLLYTFHLGEDYKWLENALQYRDDEGKPMQYMALGGLVGRSKNQRIIFLNQCFKIIKNSSNPNIKVHGFGVSSEKLWRKYPFESCDSSTPVITAQHQAEKVSIYQTENYEKVFKPRGWTKDKAISMNKEPETKLEKLNRKADENTKLLISNIEYWNNLANEISNSVE